MFADEIRLAIEASSRIALPAVTALLWRAYGEGKVSEAEAEALSGLIEARQVSARSGENLCHPKVLRSPDLVISMPSDPALLPTRQNPPRTGVGSRPRTDASLERRHRWAASGRLPPALAARFTLAEQAVLALLAAETARRGDCRLTIGHMAAVVGVSRSTVKAAIRQAKKIGLLTVEERRATGFRNLANVVRIVSPEWTAWLRLARKGAVLNTHPSLSKGGGVKSYSSTPTQVSKQGKTRTAGSSRRSTAPLDPSSREASRSAGARPRRCAGEGAAPGPR